MADDNVQHGIDDDPNNDAEKGAALGGLGGAAVGSLATGAGYEINNKQQMDRLEDDYRNERISRREYESRKTQIERGSIIY